MKSIHLLGMLASALFTSQADAFLLVNDSGVPNDAPVVDFAQFAPAGRTLFFPSTPPREIDVIPNDVVLLRVIAGFTLILGDGTPQEPDLNSYLLTSNGRWNFERKGFLGLERQFPDGPPSVARLEFASGPVAIVGGLFNYVPDHPWLIVGPVEMAALDQNLNVLETHTIDLEAPISTPGQLNAGAFRGIRRSQNDIFALEIRAPFAVIDDIRFARVPEPCTIGLLALALGFTALNCRANR